MARLGGNVLVVTGAGSGIGYVTAVRAAEEGAKVVLADIASEGIGRCQKEIERAGGTALAVEVDVTDESSVKDLFARTQSTHGGVTSLFANAGAWRPADDNKITTLGTDAWDRILDINLKGTYLVIKYAVPQLLERGGGSIVTVASAAATHAQVGVGAAYTASKGGVLSLSRLLAGELARKKIRVNCLCPGPIRTPLTADLQDRYNVTTPLGRTGRPIDIANAVVYLTSAEADFVTGLTLNIDGGLSATLAG